MNCDSLTITSYTFTDYHPQGQTISTGLINISTPPIQDNSFCSISMSCCLEFTVLCQDFDERLLTSHQSEYPCMEDAHLVTMDEETQRNWEEKKR
ncbi:hypothetical protein PAXRUDRAFT_152152 [Paxillus rubicundulus Ve08.2h10]|uniref:Unplaced genomic scaffold scaffold_707, whole genome shotgun sequence n=1 Tax=Paxillus rubicundulus Ve08.2h10 TaxID=930991 RepID=A0A0D0DVN9_9AGAM|nr:hypothetical protein PAXRUDRAFT_152152 [Paxillus rubicundulus Ve08.2h10]